MVKRVGYISMLCVGSLMAFNAKADSIQEPETRALASSTQANNPGSFGAIDQDLMNIVSQLMYGKTTGQVIDELVYTYGNGAQMVTSLSSISQMLYKQLGYLNIAVESAQAVVAVLPPTSPHLVAAKLIINELSVLVTCVQTILAQVQQSAQPPAAAPATTQPAAPAAVAQTPAPSSVSSTTAPGSNAALANAAISLLSDVASAIVASHAAASTPSSAAASQTTSSAPASSNSSTHHHGHGW
jgi:hypothetical protein